MMLWLRAWLLRLIGTAVVCTVASALTPEGTAKKGVRLVCGIGILAALLSGFLQWNWEDYSVSLAEYRQKAAEITEKAEEERDLLLRSCIEEKISTYIWDKAKSLGLSFTDVSVQAQWSEEGCWTVKTVELRGNWQEEQKQELLCFLQGELGILPERVQWEETDEMGEVKKLDTEE